MKKRVLLSILLLVTAIGFSQNTITGTIKDQNDIPLGGVSISIQNSTGGTVSGFDGNYSIQAQNDDTLVFSYIGFKTQTLSVNGQTTVNLTMQEDTEQLNEVVVTALGIKKEKKALGYAVQQVEGGSLEKAKESNFVNSLSGRVAGLTVKNSTDLFQSPEINLRGSSPLLVIDGVPDRTADIWKINTDNIENISVLKGATASALYGSVGRNGAIMITTKKGKKGKISVSFSNSTMFQPSFIKVPEVQTTYGNGNKGVYAYTDGSGSDAEGGGWIWGPKLNQPDPSTPSGFVETTQYNSPIDPLTGKLIPIPFINRGKDNIKNFFRTGLIQSNNVSVDWGSEKASYRVSLSNVYQRGIVPNTDLKNTSFSVGGSINPSDNLKVTSSLTYNKQYTNNFPEVGYGPTNYLYNLILWTGVDVDVNDLRNYWKEGQEGYQQRHFNVSYYNNPYFQAYEYLRGYNKDNTFGNINFEYNITPKLSLKGRSGVNVYSLYRTYKEPKSYVGYNKKSRGNFTIENTNYLDITSELGIKYKNNLTKDISINGELAYANYYKNSTFHATATDGLYLPGFYNLENNEGTTLFGKNNLTKETIHSFYGFVDLEFYNAFYLTFTGRNDKTSTLPEKNNSFFYPSISGSIVLSNLFNLPSWTSFAKLRGSWSRVSEGRIENVEGVIENDSYNHIQAYKKGTNWNGTPSYYVENTLLYPRLFPETSDTWEIGTYIRLFQNRLGLDVAYYQAKDYNNLIPNSISEASGYAYLLLNGNILKRKGIEFTLDATPIKTDHFQWNTQINLSQHREYQVEIYGDKEQTEDLIRVGERTDRIYAEVYQTTEKGELILEKGLPVSDPYKRYIGYDEPDWTYGISNNIAYKNFKLSFLFDGRIGGLIYSTTNQKMWWGGTSPGTINQYRDDANSGKSTYVAPGVKVVSGAVEYDLNGNIVNDTRTYAPNDVAVNYIDYMQTTSNYHNKNYHYYKETFIKLREVTLTYNFGKSFIEKTPFSDLSLSFVGRNLWLSSEIPNVDPDSGVDNLQTPSTRSIGFNINAKF